jgi:hypothetical protein
MAGAGIESADAVSQNQSQTFHRYLGTEPATVGQRHRGQVACSVSRAKVACSTMIPGGGVNIHPSLFPHRSTNALGLVGCIGVAQKPFERHIDEVRVAKTR